MIKRPDKPRLEWKNVRRKTVPRYRITWTEGGKRREKAITLDWKGDPQELDRLYWLCARGEHPAQKPPAPQTSWRALIVAWRTDPRVQKRLADGTKVSYRRTMDGLLENNADKDVCLTTRKHVRAIHDKLAATPRKADHYVQVIRFLWNYAVEKLDWDIGPNPATGIELFGRTREFKPWPEWMVKAAEQAPEDVRTVVEVILGTGQRPNAAITMRHDDFWDEWMRVLDEKGAALHEVYCPLRLRNFVSTMKKNGAYLIARNLTQPKGYDAVEHQFRAWRGTLGDRAQEFTLHGLRKLACVQLAEANCGDALIQAVTGQSPKTVAYYRRLADKKKLSKMAQIMRDQNENKT